MGGSIELEQVRVLSFPGKPATNSRTPEGWKAWLSLTENPNQKPGIEIESRATPSPHAFDCATAHPTVNIAELNSVAAQRGREPKHSSE